MGKHSIKRRPWTEVEIAIVCERYATSINRDLAAELKRPIKSLEVKAWSLGLHKDIEHIRAVSRANTLRPWHASKLHRFKKGEAPWNKGKPGSTGLHPNSRVNQFKPGHPGTATKPIGSLRINRDGVLERKIGNTPGPSNRRWKPVHRLVWQAAHGPVPKGHIVVFKPGRASTDAGAITLDAVELISRAENMRRNSVQRYGKDISGLIQLRGVLMRQINKRDSK